MATTIFTTSQVSPFCYGRFDDGVANAARYRFMATHSACHLQITGTDAVLKCGGSLTQPFHVSVDGGSETNPAISSGQITLFSGLSDAAHIVNIRLHDSYSGGAGWFTRTNCLDVTGASPAIALDPVYGPYERVVGSSLGVSSLFPLTQDFYTSPQIGKCYGAEGFVIRGKGEKIYAWTGCSSAYGMDLYVDGVYHSTTNTSTSNGVYKWYLLASDISNTVEHEYTIILDHSNSDTRISLDAVMFGGSGAAVSSTPVVAKDRVAMWGDSITQHSVPCGTVGRGNGYVRRTAFALGLLPYNRGVSGNTTSQVDARIASELSTIVSTHGDPKLIVLNPGRNDSSSGADPFKATYRAMVDKAVAGTTTSKIVCLCPWNFSDSLGICVKIAEVVSDVANPRVVLLYNSTSPAITIASGRSCDDLHPTDSGSQDMANWLAPLLQPYLGGGNIGSGVFSGRAIGVGRTFRGLIG